MPRLGSPYGPAYQRQRAMLLGRPCALRLVCLGAPADSADHFPALSEHEHRQGSGCCVLRPACQRCQWEQGRRLGRGGARRARSGARRARRIPEPSRLW